MAPPTSNADDTTTGVIPLGRAQLMFATVAVMAATAMQAADATIVNVALPQLERDLGGSVVLGGWVMTSYLCANALVAPLTGWLRRRFGARQLISGAVGVFVAASLLCALAPSPAAIILFRVIQGAGGGVIHPLAQAIVLDLYPRRQHGRMLGIWGAMIMAGPILGPALGGVITDLASWRWAFAINLPVGLLVIWGMRVLPKAAPVAGRSLDVAGIALLAVAVGALQLCLERSVGRSWLHSPELLLEMAIAAAAFVAIAVQARRGRFTVFRLELFRDVNFAAAAFYNFMTSALLFVAIVFVPALGQGPLGYNATVAGLTIVPRGILMMVAMLVVGQALGKIDFRILLIVGLGLMAGGLAMLAVVEPRAAVTWLVGGTTMQAIGGGMLFTSLSTLGFATLPPEMRTDAAGVYSLVRQLGFASGTALMTAVLRARIETNLAAFGNSPSPQAHDIAALRAYSICFAAMAVAALVMLPGVWLFRAGTLDRRAERTA